MTTIDSTYAVITNAGRAAALAAGVSGPMIQITGFTIGSTSAAEGGTAAVTDTAISNLVYTGSTTQISYMVVSDEAAVFRVFLDENVGDFDIGQIGLTMSGGTLFAKVVLPKKQAKWKTNAPSVIGNIKTYDIVLVLPQVESCIDLTLLRANTAALPEVATEANLPAAVSAPYPVYLVRNHTEIGVPVIASRRNSTWYFAPSRDVAGQGEGVIPVGSAQFDASVKINMAVYYDAATKTFKPADPSDTTGVKMPVGIRTSTFEITRLGPVKRYTTDDVWPASPTLNTWLFTQTGANAGKPNTTATWAPYGYVLGTNLIWVDFDFSRNAWNGQTVTGTPPQWPSHTHPNATASVPGFMSSADYSKLAAPESFVIGSDGIITAALATGRVSVKLDPNTIDDFLNSRILANRGLRKVWDTASNTLTIQNDIGTGVRDTMVP